MRLYQLDRTPPSFVLDTLAMGPRNPVSDKFDPNDVLVELDRFMKHCEGKFIDKELLTDINVKTLNYIKKCKSLKCSRNLMLTKKYLIDNDLLAIPFDKGVGICIMKKEVYHAKMKTILELPQFEKWVPPRKNAKHPLLKEEERISDILREMKEEGKIGNELYERLKPKGSQPARLYGLAKVHKQDTPVRPVLSMPGSVYYNVAKQVAKWLSFIPECQINCDTKTICDTLSTVTLDENEELVSFDVVSLYTNVPVMEAIHVCADLLYNKFTLLPVDKETFIELAKIASCNVLMLTHDGYYKQLDGLAMGSPPAPMLANGWMSQFDSRIKDNAKLYFRYMDDIFRNIVKSLSDQKLEEINDLHKSLTFTRERENNGLLPMLDMGVYNKKGQLSSTWYCKPSDTGLILNYHALAPKRYKRAVVAGFVHRIYRACSTWQLFHESLDRAKIILIKNQYPAPFFEKIIHDTLTRIFKPEERHEKEVGENKPHMIFLQYRGKCSEAYARDIHNLCQKTVPITNIEARVVFTLRKMKTVMPSLKQPVEMFLRSRLVYKIQCPHCNVCYVGKTSRHLQDRFGEHFRKGPVKAHLAKCEGQITREHVSILGTTTKSEIHLKTLEALWIREYKPYLNTQDTMKSRDLKLTIKL